METRITVIGNLTKDADRKEKQSDNSVYHILTVAANNNKTKETTFYACFVYGLSEARANLLTTGSMVYIYGTPHETVSQNPKTQQWEVNHVINVKDFEILFSKKE